jgi:hypothetical protein
MKSQFLQKIPFLFIYKLRSVHFGHLSVNVNSRLSVTTNLPLIRQGAPVRQDGIMPIHAPLVLLFFIKSAVMSSLFIGVSPCDRGYNMIRPPLLFIRVAGILLSIVSSVVTKSVVYNYKLQGVL